MGDVGSLFLGAALVAGGILLTPVSGPIGLGVMSVGLGFVRSSIRGFISGRPTPQGIQANVGSPDATVPVLYGEARIGGKVYDVRVLDGGDRELLYRGVAFCVGSENGQGIEGYQKVWWDDVLAIDPVNNGAENVGDGITSFFSGTSLYSTYLGTDTQTTPFQFQDAFGTTKWPNTSDGRGIAHMTFRWHKDKEKFPRVPNVTALIRGNRVYDPRDPTGGPDSDGFIWDSADATGSPNQNPGQNPALVLLDYLTSSRYGADRFYPERDGGDTSLSEIDEQSFISAANYCDEPVQDGDGGTQPRFSWNGWLDTGNAVPENIAAVLTSMRGVLVQQQGKYRLIIPQAQSSVMTLSEDDIIGDWSLRRGGSRSVPNRAIAKFPGGDNGEIAEDVQFPPVGDTTFVNQDGGEHQTRVMQLHGTDDPVRAEQIAMVTLREAREDAAVQFRATERAAKLEVGDVFTLDHAFPGWQGASAKDFRVVMLEFQPDFTVRLTATEYAASAYSLDSQTRPTPPPGTDLPDPTTTGAPSNLSLTSDGTTQVNLPGGDKVPGILAIWDLPTDKGIDRVVVLEREDGTSDWNRADTVEPVDDQRSLFSPKGATQGDTWEVGVYVVVGQRQLQSSITTATVTVGADFTPSSTVNLLGQDAGPERVAPGGTYRYLDKEPIATLSLEVGNKVSVSADMHGDGTSTSAGQMLIGFFDSGGSQIGGFRQSTETAQGSTAFEGVQDEAVEIPVNTVSITVQSDNVTNDGTDITVRRVMLNRGPVAAPYSDPPPIDTENLLGFDALTEVSGTGTGLAHDYFNDEPISGLGLAVGDVISYSADVKSDGSKEVRIRVEFKDSGGSSLAVHVSSFTTSTGYERHYLHGLVIPDSTATIRVSIDNGPTSGTGFGKRAMLNRGARAAPFSIPKFAFDRDDFGDLPDDIKDQIGFEGGSIPRGPLDPVNIQTVIGNLGDSGHPTGSMDASSALARGSITISQSADLAGRAVIAVDDFVLYWYDPDTSSLSGLRVGAKLDGSNDTNPGDFDIRKGGETVTIPGSTQPASANTTYHVYWQRGSASISVTTNKANALDWDLVFLGTIETGSDTFNGGGGAGGGTDGPGTLE